MFKITEKCENRIKELAFIAKVGVDATEEEFIEEIKKAIKVSNDEGKDRGKNG